MEEGDEGMKQDFDKKKGEVKDEKAAIVMFKDRLLRERERQELETEK